MATLTNDEIEILFKKYSHQEKTDTYIGEYYQPSNPVLNLSEFIKAIKEYDELKSKKE